MYAKFSFMNQVDLSLKENTISSSDLYYDMEYSEQFFSFTTISTGLIYNLDV